VESQAALGRSREEVSMQIRNRAHEAARTGDSDDSQQHPTDGSRLRSVLWFGTTLVACERLGRFGYGVEIDAGYAAVTLEWLASMGLELEVVKWS
jgi:hypothetical protein